MNNSTDESSTKELMLLSPSGSFLPLQVVNLDLIKKNNVLFECHIVFQITSKFYQQIDTESLFNFKPEIRVSPTAVDFQSGIQIKVKATLQPQLLSQLAEHATNTEAAIAYLTACSQQDSDRQNPLLLTESWFALSVKQHLESGDIGYRTFWSYLNPASLTPDAIASGQLSAALEQFLKDRNEADLSQVGQAISAAFEEMANGFKDWEPFKNWDQQEFFQQTETAITEIFAEVTQALEQISQVRAEESSSTANAAETTRSIGRIYQAMIRFFSEDDWAFAKQQGESTLKLAFQGKHGQWNCYARAIEERQQFIFHSVCPLKILENHQATILELLSRVNAGCAIGNFEFNFTDRMIHFRTSIDVTGDRLTSALIKRLVYTNVLIMDDSLPGIEAVLAGETPEAAIAAIKQSK